MANSVAALWRSNEVRALFARIAPRYDLNNTLLSVGMHRCWKRQLVRAAALPPHGRILDVCTGTGDLLLLMSETTAAIGLDFCRQMLAVARPKLSARQSQCLLQGDVLHLPLPDAVFDVVTIAYGLRNLEDLHAGLDEIRRVLKPGGRLAALEFGQPRGLFGAVFRFYSRFLLPHVGGLISGDRQAYRYLHNSLWRFPCGAALMTIVEQCGFRPLECRKLSGGISYLYLAARA